MARPRLARDEHWLMNLLKNPVAPSPSPPAAPLQAERANPLGLVVLVAVAVGLCLRIVAAKGDLWLDEIWTLRLLEPVKSLGDVFFKVHHDNNHFFNSAWIWLIGPDASILLMRLPAILLGTFGVLAARAVGRRFSEASGVIAALLMAIGYFFVHYGSEARGYAGMILAVLVAYDALLAILDGKARTRNTIVFAAAICIGTFFHLTMVEATAALCASFFARSWSRGEGLAAALRRSLPIGLAAAAATLPAVGLFVHGAFAPDFRVGAMEPFTFALLGQGLSGVARTVLGLPQAMDDAAVVAVAAAFALAMLALVPAGRRWFPAIAIFGLPLAHVALRLPSQFYPRFHLTAAIGLLLLTSDGLAALWSRNGAARGASIMILALIVVGQASNLASFLSLGRGDYVAAFKRMSERGPVTYAADFAKGETRAVVEYEADRAGIAATRVLEQDWCVKAPDWLISVATPNTPLDLPARKTAGPAACPTIYQRDESFPAWGLSGFAWTLYRRDE